MMMRWAFQWRLRDWSLRLFIHEVERQLQAKPTCVSLTTTTRKSPIDFVSLRQSFEKLCHFFDFRNNFYFLSSLWVIQTLFLSLVRKGIHEAREKVAKERTKIKIKAKEKWKSIFRRKSEKGCGAVALFWHLVSVVCCCWCGAKKKRGGGRATSTKSLLIHFQADVARYIATWGVDVCSSDVCCAVYFAPSSIDVIDSYSSVWSASSSSCFYFGEWSSSINRFSWELLEKYLLH